MCHLLAERFPEQRLAPAQDDALQPACEQWMFFAPSTLDWPPDMLEPIPALQAYLQRLTSTPAEDREAAHRYMHGNPVTADAELLIPRRLAMQYSSTPDAVRFMYSAPELLHSAGEIVA